MTKEFNEAATDATAQDPAVPTKESPMIIDRLRGREDGGVEFIMSLSREQTYVLVNFAVMALISQGLAVFNDESEASPEEQLKQAEEPAAETEVKLGKQIH